MSVNFAVLITIFMFLVSGCSATTTQLAGHPSKKNIDYNPKLHVGAEQYHRYKSLLKGKRIGLIVNQTSQVNGQHLVDFLLEKQLTITKIFAPEHGFRGDHDAGSPINSSIDAATGIEIVSIYGKNKKPSPHILKDIDVLIFDIQDVGVRYYTYISSMHYMMEAAAEQDKTFIVFDRPNPNGSYVDGPVLDLKFKSFVGMHPIPLLHGMTVGELAQMINGEGWLADNKHVDLTVISVANYERHFHFSLPVKPSPNLPNDTSVALYPSLGFFEGTPISIGRGTDFPFQVIGYNKFNHGKFSFTPRSIKGASENPKFKNQNVNGIDLRASSSSGLNITYLIEWHKLFAKHNEKFFTYAKFFDKLAGTDTFRKQIISGLSSADIRQSWQPQISTFLRQRTPYLIYPNHH